MSALLESLEGWAGSGAILILDDLHEIAGSAAERVLEQFVELRPHALRVLVGSRRQPEMNIPRLRVSGLLQEISSDDLRFRSWEVEELFISVFREPLSPESAAALTRRTGGWAAGLQLFHLATSGRSAVRPAAGGRGPGRPVEAGPLLPGPQRAGRVARGAPAVPAAHLHARLADRRPVRRTAGDHRQPKGSRRTRAAAAVHLLRGRRRDLPLPRGAAHPPGVGAGRGVRAAGARQWYSRSAALLESIGDQRAAVRAYARAEDWGAVARLIQTRGSGPDDAAAGTDLLLPASVVEHDPWLSLAEARRRVREGALGAAVEAFRQAESLLDEPEFRESCRRERSVAAMWSTGRPVGRAFDPPHRNPALVHHVRVATIGWHRTRRRRRRHRTGGWFPRAIGSAPYRPLG